MSYGFHTGTDEASRPDIPQRRSQKLETLCRTSPANALSAGVARRTRKATHDLRRTPFGRMEFAAAVDAGFRSVNEIKAAQQAQARLFPRRLPQLQTLAYAGVCAQARHVGGDCYDLLDRGPGRLGLVVSDVAGKGVPAALQMASLQASLRSQAAVSGDLKPLLMSVNHLFHQNTSETGYATLFFGEYDEAVRRLCYVNCGHPAPLLLHRDHSASWLRSTCMPLVLFEDWECSTAEIQLVPGDILLLYTDGVTEARNENGEEFGQQRLGRIACSCSHLPVSTMLRTIVDAVRGFGDNEEQDDITLVAARCGNSQPFPEQEDRV